MEEELRPPVSFGERLRQTLGESRKIGFATYMVVVGRAKDQAPIDLSIPTADGRSLPWDYRANVEDELRNKGLIVGGGVTDSPDRLSVKLESTPSSLLESYLRLLEDYTTELKKADKEGKTREVPEKRFPEYLGDPMFENYWQDAFFTINGTSAQYQYMKTNLRAVLLGFGEAAEHFKDIESASLARTTVNASKEQGRKDPLKIAGLIIEPN